MRSAARGLRRSPAFVIIAIATLATAIAVNAAMFSFMNAIFFRPLPYPEPDQLYDLRIEPPVSGQFAPPPVFEVAQHMERFGELAPYTERGFVVSMDESDMVSGSVVDHRLMRMLGMSPVLGRTFAAGDAQAGAAPTVVVGERFWRARLGGASDVLGRTLRIDGKERIVIGVVPDRVTFPDFAQLWIAQPLEQERVDAVQSIYRLKPGTTALAAAAAEAALTAAGTPARVLLFTMRPQGGALLVAVLGAIGFVLLIACSNVANLVLARGTARRHELGVRSALGASRAALLRHLSLEGAIIVGIAAVIGTVCSTWLLDLIIAVIPTDGLPIAIDPSLDARVLAYVVLLAGFAVLISSVLPGVTITRGALATTLRESGTRAVGDAAAGRMRMTLVVTQIALATVLLGGAGLLVRGLVALGAVDPGYPADAILELRTLRPPSAAAFDDFPQRAITQLSAVPGVAQSAATAPARAAGRITPIGNPDRVLSATVEAVSPTYFETLGLRLSHGASFQPGAAGDDVAVISEQVARTLFASPPDALGATFSFESDPARRVFTVIGVAADRQSSLGSRGGVAIVPRVYLPLIHGDLQAVRLLARSAAGDPLRLAATASDALRQLDRDAVVRPARVLGDVERDESGNLRWFATVFGAFGAIALALAALGISSVVAFGVNRRMREIGVRMTLGATSGRVVREIMAGILPAAGIGLGVGLLGAMGVGQLLRAVMHGFSPIDPVTIAGVMLGFAAVTMLAAWLPARRAASVDPMRVLRE